MESTRKKKHKGFFSDLEISSGFRGLKMFILASKNVACKANLRLFKAKMKMTAIKLEITSRHLSKDDIYLAQL